MDKATILRLTRLANGVLSHFYFSKEEKEDIISKSLIRYVNSQQRIEENGDNFFGKIVKNMALDHIRNTDRRIKPYPLETNLQVHELQDEQNSNVFKDIIFMESLKSIIPTLPKNAQFALETLLSGQKWPEQNSLKSKAHRGLMQLQSIIRANGGSLV